MSAPEIEGAVAQTILAIPRDAQRVASLSSSPDPSPSEIEALVDTAKAFAENISRRPSYEQLVHLKPAIAKVVIGAQQISVSVRRQQLESIVRGLPPRRMHPMPTPASDNDSDLITTALPMRLGRRGRETRLILQSGQVKQRPIDASLVMMISRGYAWRHQITSGEIGSLRNIASREKVTESYVSRLVTLGFLAPDIITAILDGSAPAELTANRLQSLRDLPLDWPSQRQILGFVAV